MNTAILSSPWLLSNSPSDGRRRVAVVDEGRRVSRWFKLTRWGKLPFKLGLQLRAEASNNNTPQREEREREKKGVGNGVFQGPILSPSELTIHGIPHLRDYLPELHLYPNPLHENCFFHLGDDYWVRDSEMVVCNTAIDLADPISNTQAYFHRAGPRSHVAFGPGGSHAAVVTCGGLCPGLNTVVRELVNALWYQYAVRDITGIESGYRGFYSDDAKGALRLSPELVDSWHKAGGTMLGTSRGGFDLQKIVDAIQKKGFNQVYIIGGDGTLRGAVKIFEETRRRGLRVSIIGIPKTVDNDVGIIDRSFGFQTAVEMAQGAINAAHTEATSTPNGVGLVKLMGRYAGHIALQATLSSRDVDCCLIPEVPFYMEGGGGLLEFLDDRLKSNGHCVIVVAEGAGQDLIIGKEGIDKEAIKDPSGNIQLQDIGVWLADHLKKWWKEKHLEEPFSVKRIDPTYMVRAVPSNATDTAYCTLLAHSAIHGAMAGYTGFVAGLVNGNFCYIPLDMISTTQHFVDVQDHTWAWVKSVNNQPDFLRTNEEKDAVEEMEKIDENKDEVEDMEKIA